MKNFENKCNKVFYTIDELINLIPFLNKDIITLMCSDGAIPTRAIGGQMLIPAWYVDQTQRVIGLMGGVVK